MKKKTRIWLETEMVESEAFNAIKKPAAIRVLLRFFLKIQVENKNINHKRRPFEPIRDRDGDIKIANNGKIEFTYSEAKARVGIKSDQTFTNAIDELIELGFIDIAESGYGVQRIKTLYAISKRWKLYGTPEFATKKRQKRVQSIGFKRKKTRDSI